MHEGKRNTSRSNHGGPLGLLPASWCHSVIFCQASQWKAAERRTSPHCLPMVVLLFATVVFCVYLLLPLLCERPIKAKKSVWVGGGTNEGCGKKNFAAHEKEEHKMSSDHAIFSKLPRTHTHNCCLKQVKALVTWFFCCTLGYYFGHSGCEKKRLLRQSLWH